MGITLDIDAVILSMHKVFERERREGGLSIGSHYLDPENERIMEFLGAAWDDTDGPNALRFRDIETGEVVDLFEWEMGEEWAHMNAMEVLAWAAGDDQTAVQGPAIS